MKSTYYIYLVLISFLSLIACDSDLDKVTYHPSEGVPAILSPIGERYVLLPQEASEVIMILKWTKADMGFDTKFTNDVELDFAGNNFANKITISVTTTNVTVDSLTVGQLNQGIVQLMGDDMEFKEYDFELRIASYLSQSATSLYSNVITTKITPYYSERDYPKIAARGGYADLMWGYNESQFLYSEDGDGVYTGWILFGAGQAESGWKLCEDINWVNQWGGDEDFEPEAPKLTLSTGDNPPAITNYSGYGYKFSFTKASAELQIIHAIDSWGIHIVGGNQAEDKKMSLLAREANIDGTYSWYVRGDINLEEDGEIIFRADNNPEITYGTGTGSRLIENGEGIPLAKGNYRIRFYFNKVEPTYQIIER